VNASSWGILEKTFSAKVPLSLLCSEYHQQVKIGSKGSQSRVVIYWGLTNPENLPPAYRLLPPRLCGEIEPCFGSEATLSRRIINLMCNSLSLRAKS